MALSSMVCRTWGLVVGFFLYPAAGVSPDDEFLDFVIREDEKRVDVTLSMCPLKPTAGSVLSPLVS